MINANERLTTNQVMKRAMISTLIIDKYSLQSQ